MDWNRIRYGRVGGSESEALLVKGKSAHGLGTGAISMLYDKVWEIKTSSPAKDVFVNDAMQRGIDLEGEAIYNYQNEHFKTVTQCGYVTNEDKRYAGYSPDGLIGEDGLIEIKCPGSREYVRTLIEGDIPKRYQAQMQWGMMLTGRSWCDYVVYNPDFESNSMVVQKVERDDDMIELLLDNYLVFENLMNQALNRLG
jgi:putative phage-type endonuclease